MAKQLYNHGDVIQAGSNALEVTGVSYQEVDGEKVNLAYTVRLKADVDAERKAEAERVAAEEAQQAKGDEVAAEQSENLTPNVTSDAEEGTE